MVNLSGLFSCGSGTVIGRAVFEKKKSSEKEIYLNVLGAEAGKGGGGVNVYVIVILSMSESM